MVEQHAREMEAGRTAGECDVGREGQPTYTEPVALGRWNVFTRAPSENPNEGLFEFDFGR